MSPRSPRRDQGGFTLVELAVAMALTALVVTVVLQVFLGALRAGRVTAARTATSADLRVAMEQLTRELRVATRPAGTAAALISAGPTGLSFYALLDRTGTAVAANADVAPTRIDYIYDGTCLRAAQTAMLPSGGTWVPAAAPSRSTCLLRTTTAPRFGYFATAAISVAGVDTPELAATPSLAPDARSGVRSVEVTLTAAGPDAPDLTGQVQRSRVTLTNLAAGGG